MNSKVVLGIVLLTTLIPSTIAAREWIDATGRFRIEAELVAVRGDKVILEKKDGSLATVPLSQLSANDQKFLKELAVKQRATTPGRTAAVPDDAASSTQTSPAAELLASQAHALLTTHCYRCHGENQSNEGGFGFAIDREKLVAAGYVVPQAPQRSPLIERIEAADSPMPPEGESPRPTPSEIAVIRSWIQAGAPSIARPSDRPLMATQDVYKSIFNDLRSINERDRVFARYFSVTHLANRGLSAEELETYRVALAKLLNSLSWNRQFVSLHPVAGQPSVFRIDLRDVKWTDSSWMQIVSRYPHGLVVDSREAYNVRAATKTDVPLIRADWFVANAARPPLYHELLQIPSTDTQLEMLLQVDVQRNIEQGRVTRIGFARSGVSQHNRMIERHESIFGAYWKSYDFSGNTGAKNLFENPIGPGNAAGMFAHDGGEIIFHLPNGMLAFMLTDSAGRRIERGPVEIVSDPRQPDRTVVNGVSCMSCHHSGLIQKADEIRPHVTANARAYADLSNILKLYPESSEAVRQLFAQDSLLFTTALANSEIGIAKPTQASEPIVLISNRYSTEVDLPMAAAELGMPPEQLTALLAKLDDVDLNRTLGVLKTQAGVIKRETFDQMFGEIATRFGIGERLQTPANGRRTAQTPKTTNRTQSVAANNNAIELLRSGIEAIKNQQWQDADEFFTAALKMTDDPVLKARIFEQAIPLYERGETPERLIAAHLHLLDLCQNTAAITQARVDFFNSILRFVEKSPRWFSTTDKSESIRWSSKIPTSVSSVIASAFESRLQENPDHEPSLRVMQLFWRHVQDSPRDRMSAVAKLREILKKRGETLDIPDSADLAELILLHGNPSDSAEVYAEIASRVEGSRAAHFRLQEAVALSKTDQPDRAIAALKRVTRDLARYRDGATTMNLTRVGDLYGSLDQPALAAEVYRTAIKGEQNAYRVRMLQDKIANAKAATGNSASPENTNKTMDGLLDPARPFRIEAEQYETYAKSNDSVAFHNLIQAVESWIKAEDPKRAEATLKKAAIALRRNSPLSAETDNARIGSLYEKIELRQEAVNYYLAALKLTNYEHQIETYQIKIRSLSEFDNAIKLTPADAAIVDPKYKLIFMAKKAEDQQAYDAASQARAFVQATQLWSQAGEVAEVKRAGAKADLAIKRLVSTNSFNREEGLYVELATAYRSAELFQESIDAYVLAISHANNDDKAVKHFQQIEIICQEKELPLPKLDTLSAAKLDPLNRFRVDAAKAEQQAKQDASGSSTKTYYRRAIELWMKGESKADAVRVVNDLSKHIQKATGINDYDFEWVAKVCEKLEEPGLAIEHYELGIQNAKSELRKKNFRQRIESLRQ